MSEHHCRHVKKALADGMTAAAYNVINTVNCRMKLNVTKFVPVLATFARQFKMFDGFK